jgi:hypothetical protein
LELAGIAEMSYGDFVEYLKEFKGTENKFPSALNLFDKEYSCIGDLLIQKKLLYYQDKD